MWILQKNYTKKIFKEDQAMGISQFVYRYNLQTTYSFCMMEKQPDKCKNYTYFDLTSNYLLNVYSSLHICHIKTNNSGGQGKLSWSRFSTENHQGMTIN